MATKTLHETWTKSSEKLRVPDMPVIMSDVLKDVIELNDDIVLEQQRIVSVSISNKGPSTKAKVVLAGVEGIDDAMQFMGRSVKFKGERFTLNFVVDKASHETGTGMVKLSGIVVNS